MDYSEQFLREAIQLSAEKMEANEGGPFGALIVQKGNVIGRGWNRVTSSNDPTAHAEVMAIRDACNFLGTFSLDRCEWHFLKLLLHDIYSDALSRSFHGEGGLKVDRAWVFF